LRQKLQLKIAECAGNLSSEELRTKLGEFRRSSESEFQDMQRNSVGIQEKVKKVAVHSEKIVGNIQRLKYRKTNVEKLINSVRTQVVRLE
jgi:hypothetical protein